MPEGPSIVILKEAVQAFEGKKILRVDGNTKVDISGLANQPLTDFKSWGKHFLICTPKQTVRIHFMLFGSYSINELAETKKPRLHLHFRKGDLYFYACSVKLIEDDPDTVYDWSGDVMNDTWDPKKARQKLKSQPDTLVCDAILDQSIFAGAGNIIKNEVLFRIRVHPESTIGELPPRKLTELIKEVRTYSFDFLEWKKNFELKKHWQAHAKKICPRCNIPLIKEQHLGKAKRRAFYCENCQVLYKKSSKLKTRKPKHKSAIHI
jgi:endonuclease VIII